MSCVLDPSCLLLSACKHAAAQGQANAAGKGQAFAATAGSVQAVNDCLPDQAPTPPPTPPPTSPVEPPPVTPSPSPVQPVVEPAAPEDQPEEPANEIDSTTTGTNDASPSPSPSVGTVPGAGLSVRVSCTVAVDNAPCRCCTYMPVMVDQPASHGMTCNSLTSQNLPNPSGGLHASAFLRCACANVSVCLHGHMSDAANPMHNAGSCGAGGCPKDTKTLPPAATQVCALQGLSVHGASAMSAGMTHRGRRLFWLLALQALHC